MALRRAGKRAIVVFIFLYIGSFIVEFSFTFGSSATFIVGLIQVISYSTQAREQSYDLASKAIRRAIQHCHDHDTLTSNSKRNESNSTKEKVESEVRPKDAAPGSAAVSKSAKGARPHDTPDDHDVDASSQEASGPLALLKKALLEKYGNAQAAFDELSNSDGIVGRKEFKKAIKKTSLSKDFTGKELKTLRAKLPKKATQSQFCSFLDGSPYDSESTEPTKSSHLASLPPEVPQLPSSFRSRDHAQTQLTTALLESGRRSTSLTAPKSRISSQGMGGVGKTM